jgi:hypothetical protein
MRAQPASRCSGVGVEYRSRRVLLWGRAGAQEVKLKLNQKRQLEFDREREDRSGDGSTIDLVGAWDTNTNRWART